MFAGGRNPLTVLNEYGEPENATNMRQPISADEMQNEMTNGFRHFVLHLTCQPKSSCCAPMSFKMLIKVRINHWRTHQTQPFNIHQPPSIVSLPPNNHPIN
jgi:hypothetical protein